MDTSKEYILMCELAVEIQELCQKDFGSYNPVFCGITYDENDVFYYGLKSVHGSKTKYSVWLPRQAQLQLMLNGMYKFTPHILIMIHKFHKWFDSEVFGYQPDLLSMEQLWLAFVMKEKYNLLWDSTDWEEYV